MLTAFRLQEDIKRVPSTYKRMLGAFRLEKDFKCVRLEKNVNYLPSRRGC
jgi:hypothetical protein